MLLDKETYDDFMKRFDEVDELLNAGRPPYTTIAAVRFASIEADLDRLLERGRVNVVENDGFVERLLEVWNRLKTS